MERLSVTQLNLLIARHFEASPRFSNIEVEAEVGRLTRHGSGHYYFTIKDNNSSIDCVMYRSSVAKSPHDFEQGDSLLLKGRISYYEKTGRTQFIVSSVEPLGEGALLKAFLELRDKFEKMGLLDPGLKKPIPRLPGRIALLTSPTGAAYKDFLKIFTERNPFCQVDLYPVLVQGQGAASSIIEALKKADADLLVLTRGGGSYEDLAVFNDEELCLTLAQLEIPSICAIGHEIDFTLAELVADLRAATPSQAAELASDDLISLINNLMSRLKIKGKNRLLDLDKRIISLDASMDRMEMRLKQRYVNEQRQVEDLFISAENRMKNKLKEELNLLDQLYTRIASYNPEEILKRGYVALSQDGWVKRKDQLKEGQADIHFYDGIRKVRIDEGL